ncbi:MAG: serine/threonine protein kinase [Myxococcaceae bacterium]|nr:serine/threonine protein kinase [Myxococcaceae bacterium]
MLIDHVIGGKYRITELIGQGGMGTVFEAVHNGTGSRVAIKLIVSNDIKEEVFVRFQREARAAGTIDSLHIVRIFDMGTDERSGSPYMVMERLIGEDLSQLMRRVGPLEPTVACALIAQSALGLAKAHESGVVHRDIKPANLFLHDGGDHGEVVVKILDFGIAKVLMDVMQRSEEGGLTRTGSMLGSPHYMSPEQAQGLRSIDHRSDIWSLGVVLYKMLCGQTPHAHLQTLGQVILAICSQPSRPIQELAPWVPPEVAMIVHRALQPDPGQRFQSAYEMQAALQAVLQNAPKFRRIDIQPLSSTQRMRIAPSAGAFRSDVPTNGTQHGMTQSPAHQATGKTSSGLLFAMLAAGVLGAVGLAGIGAAMIAKKPHVAVNPPTTTSTVPATLTPVDPMTGAPTVTSTATAATNAPAERTVSLAISPANAVVEIDGTKQDVVNGAVQLKGPLGAVVSVHITAAGADTTQGVAITEGGAIPPKIAMSPPSIAAANTAATAANPGPRPTAKPPGPATAKPPASGSPLNAQRTFE